MCLLRELLGPIQTRFTFCSGPFFGTSRALLRTLATPLPFSSGTLLRIHPGPLRDIEIASCFSVWYLNVLLYAGILCSNFFGIRIRGKAALGLLEQDAKISSWECDVLGKYHFCCNFREADTTSKAFAHAIAGVKSGCVLCCRSVLHAMALL